MADVVEDCIALLETLGVALSPGLTPYELAGIEREFGFTFGLDHRDFLLAAVPVGRGWVDWRGDSPAEVRDRLAWPVEGVLFDVAHNAFWAASWGPRPEIERAAIERARRELESWPTLVPVYGHRFMAAAPSGHGAPVFSVVQTDVIYYGGNLRDYLYREFAGRASAESDPVTANDSPWSLLADGHDDADL